MEILYYGKVIKEEEKKDIKFNFSQEERKLCPSCNTALMINVKVCPCCGYTYPPTEEEKNNEN